MKKSRLCWPLALLMSAAVFAALFFTVGFRFAANDDAAILRSFMGWETGRPPQFHPYLHGLLTGALRALFAISATTPWFSWMQLAFLFLSLTVIAKAVMQLFARHDHEFLREGGALVAFVVTACLGAGGVARFTFTQTAALLGAAAVAQMMSVDVKHVSNVGVCLRLLGAAALLVLAYALRQQALLPLLAFCALAFLWLCLQNPTARRGLGCALCLTAVLLGGMALWRSAEIAASGEAEYLRWQQANSAVMDYDGLNGFTKEALASTGWSDNTIRLITSQWFFLDKSISSQAFEALETQRPAVSAFARVLPTLSAFAAENRVTLVFAGLALAWLLLCLAGAARGGCGRLARLVVPVFTLLLSAAMLFYLAMQGRLPLRAAVMVLWPMAVLSVCLLPVCVSPAALRCALGVSLAAAAVYLSLLLPPLRPVAEEETIDAMAEVYEYALDEPDMLFLCDRTMMDDFNPFPDYSRGIPHNIAWYGGWTLRSRESCAQFAAFDIDLWQFDAEVFLREDVCLATQVLDPPPQLLLNYIAEMTGYEDVDCSLYGESGYVYYYQFQ